MWINFNSYYNCGKYCVASLVLSGNCLVVFLQRTGKQGSHLAVKYHCRRVKNIEVLLIAVLLLLLGSW
jgi:hypothetical protein